MELRLASRWHLVRELGERSCPPRLASQQRGHWEHFNKTWKKMLGYYKCWTAGQNLKNRLHLNLVAFQGTFRGIVFCLSATRLMINNQLRNLFLHEAPGLPLFSTPSILVSLYLEEMPQPYLKDTSSEHISLKFNYLRFWDALRLISVTQLKI